ncbi:MAG: aminotransferase class I/II [Myxococcales bacterium]|nr:aminotransferase class I/II [Myxococcales bacterium]
MSKNASTDTNKWSKRKSIKWDHYAPDVLPAWVAEMDFPLAEPIQERLRTIIDNSDSGYPSLKLDETLREAFSLRMQEKFNWTPKDLPLIYFQDAVQAIFHAVECFTQPGETLLTLTPIYPPFLEVGDILDRPCIELALKEVDNRYEIPWEDLKTAAKNAHMLLLCNPHNPTGRVFSKDELENITKIALQNDLLILSDEIHAELIYAGNKHIPTASLSPEVEAQTVTLTSATKAFNLGGFRCALMAFGSQEHQNAFALRPWQMRGGLNIFGIQATLAAWQAGDPWLKNTLELLDQNRHRVKNYIQENIPKVRTHLPEATYLAWLDCRGLELQEEPAEYFLRKGKVALSSGHLFGKAGKGFARLNFATNPETLNEILRRIELSI